MKSILSLAIGFWIGRQIYLKYDKEMQAGKINRIENRLKSHFIENGFSKEQATQKAAQLISI